MCWNPPFCNSIVSVPVSAGELALMPVRSIITFHRDTKKWTGLLGLFHLLDDDESRLSRYFHREEASSLHDTLRDAYRHPVDSEGIEELLLPITEDAELPAGILEDEFDTTSRICFLVPLEDFGEVEQ